MATSRSLNKVILIGNLTRDPAIRYTPKGSLVCTFGLATNSTWKNSAGEQKEQAEFHYIVSWNKLGEICAQLLSVGMLIYVEGEIRTRVWDSNGQRRSRTEIKINDMKVMDNKGKSGVGLENAKKKSEGGEEIVEEEEPKAPPPPPTSAVINSVPDIAPNDDLPF